MQMLRNFGEKLTVASVSDLVEKKVLFVEDGNHGENRPRKEEFAEKGIPFIRPPDLKGGRVDFVGIDCINEDGFNRVRKGIGKAGDIVLTHRATVGRIAITDDRDPPIFVTNPGTTIWRSIDESVLDQQYLYCYMRSAGFLDQLWANVGNNSTFDYVSLTQQRSLLVAFPSIDAQKSIAKTLRDIDRQIDLNSQLSRTLEQMAQVIFKSWFVDFEPIKARIAALEAGGSEEDALLATMQAISGKDEAELTRLQTEQPEQYAELRATAELFPSAMQDSELGEIPGGWEPASLSELFELHRGFDLPQKSREEGPYEVYAAGGLHGTHSQYKMEPPGIITGRSGVIGNVYLSLKKYWPLNTTLYVRQFRSCGPYYAYHLLRTLDLKSLNSGSAVPSLNRNFVHSIAVLNPGSAVLNKFEHFSSALFEQMVQNIDQSELLSTLRDTLLPKLLSGELSISDAEDHLVKEAGPANV